MTQNITRSGMNPKIEKISHSYWMCAYPSILHGTVVFRCLGSWEKSMAYLRDAYRIGDVRRLEN